MILFKFYHNDKEMLDSIRRQISDSVNPNSTVFDTENIEVGGDRTKTTMTVYNANTILTGIERDGDRYLFQLLTGYLMEGECNLCIPIDCSNENCIEIIENAYKVFGDIFNKALNTIK